MKTNEQLNDIIKDVVWHPVISSNLKELYYWEDDSPILFVKFKNDTVYAYYGVGMNLYFALLSSESKGKFFNKSIKTYSFQKVVQD